MMLLDLASADVAILNETGSFLWERLEQRSPLELAGALEREFETTKEAALRDTEVFLAEMCKRGWLRQ